MTFVPAGCRYLVVFSTNMFTCYGVAVAFCCVETVDRQPLKVSFFSVQLEIADSSMISSDRLSLNSDLAESFMIASRAEISKIEFLALCFPLQMSHSPQLYKKCVCKS